MILDRYCKNVMVLYASRWWRGACTSWVLIGFRLETAEKIQRMTSLTAVHPDGRGTANNSIPITDSFASVLATKIQPGLALSVE